MGNLDLFEFVKRVKMVRPHHFGDIYFNYLKSTSYKLKQPFENNLAQSMISI